MMCLKICRLLFIFIIIIDIFCDKTAMQLIGMIVNKHLDKLKLVFEFCTVKVECRITFIYNIILDVTLEDN